MTAKKKPRTTKIGQPKGISAGRPKGAKNKTTLFKEVMKEGFEEKLMKDGFKVFDAVVQKAIGNPIYDTNGKVMKDKETGEVLRHPADMTAAKMILDRVVPVTKAIDLNAGDLGGKGGITINIEKLLANTGNPDEVLIEDGEVIEDE